jgi:pyruvate/2-oxoacid:ferredoxin oxidoreductase beta subunit
MSAARAVRRALDAQMRGLGFSLVEILSPCPTIWGKDPVEARKWIGEKMIPNFPLNVFRDKKIEIPNTNVPPHKTVEEIVEGERKVAREGVPDARITSSILVSRSPVLAARASCCSASFWRKWACAKAWK